MSSATGSSIMMICCAASAICHFHARQDVATGHATPVLPIEERGKGCSPGPRDFYWPPHAEGMDPEEVVRFKSHDFH